MQPSWPQKQRQRGRCVGRPGQRVVAPLAGEAVRPVQDTAAHDDAAADAGAEDDARTPPSAPAAGAVGRLRQRQAVGVVGQAHGLTERRLQVAVQRLAVESGRVAVLHQPLRRCVARCADADRAGRAVHRLPGAPHQVDDAQQCGVVVGARRRHTLAPATRRPADRARLPRAWCRRRRRRSRRVDAALTPSIAA